MVAWYPLQFEPLFRQYLWGGRRLGSVLGKPIGNGTDYAESWELVDRGRDQSVVRTGSLAGQTLHTLVEQHGVDLFGRHPVPPRFPLLMKFLDAHADLSVQVHPDDARAARLDPPDLGKTEAWLILHADPGSRAYVGLRDGCTRPDLEAAVATGTVDDCLHVLQPLAGDCLFIPAGIVHALGAGLVVAEIQQASDTTYRLFDWNRTDADGRPRALHIEPGLEAINYLAGPVEPQQPQATSRDHVTRLVDCDKFVLDRWHWTGEKQVGGDESFHIGALVDGHVTLTLPDGPPISLQKGDVILLPAALGVVPMQGEHATLMDIHW